MCEKEWKRARTEDQIEERLSQILESASSLFREIPYDGVTLKNIADRAGFTRSNLYRYFSSKEEIFSALYIRVAEQWVSDVEQTLQGKYSPEAFLEQWVKLLERHRQFLELTPLLALSLERYSSREAFREMKIEVSRLSLRLSWVLQVVLPSLSDQDIYHFLRTNQILVAGAWPMGQRTVLQEEVLDELGLPGMRIDFFETFRESLALVLSGLFAAGSGAFE